jgi:Zn-dependent protease
MVYSYYLNGILSDTEGLFSALPFYFIGAVVAWLLTCLGHAIGCSIFKVKGADFGASYNPLKNISLYSVLGVLALPLLGVGWTKPTKYDSEQRGKSFAVALSGPLFCFIVSWIILFVYKFTTTPFLGSLTMGIAMAGMTFSVMNILPLPGFCGGVMVASVLPEKASALWEKTLKFYPLTATLAILLIVRSQANTFVIEKVVEFMGSLIS